MANCFSGNLSNVRQMINIYSFTYLDRNIVKIINYIRSMIDFASYLNIIIGLMPFFSAVTCFVIVFVSLYDSFSVEESRLKQIVTIYMAIDACAWFTCFCYVNYPRAFVYLNVPCFLSFVLIPIFFYRIVRFLTLSGEKEHFSRLHYLVPAIYAIVLLVWSFFVPFDVQLEIVRGKGLVYAEGYESFSIFFLSKPKMRGVFGIIYYVLIVVSLIKYFRKVEGSNSLIFKPAKGVIFLMVLSSTFLLTSLLLMFLPRSSSFISPLVVLSVIAIIMQHILLTYHIVRRQYSLYMIPDKIKNKYQPKENADTSQRRRHFGKITRKKLEAYFRYEKPYLRSDFKITDLVEVFDVNRTTISTFINRTYGMNFNRYVNRWRIKEFNRLSRLAENKGKSLQSFVTKAGFYDLRQYYRVIKREKEMSQREGSKITGLHKRNK